MVGDCADSFVYIAFLKKKSSPEDIFINFRDREREKKREEGEREGEGGRERERDREREIDQLSPACIQMGIKHATQLCAVTRN